MTETPPNDCVNLAVPVVVPELAAGGVCRFCGWLVEDGADVMQGERIAELLLPGVLLDISAPASGRCRWSPVSTTESLASGDQLGWIEPD